MQWYTLQELRLAADPPDCVATNRVFPVFEDEGALLARVIEVESGVRVLDVGTGCGVIALAAAKLGALVTGVDTNRRALDCAVANATTNGLEERVRWVQSDLFSELGNDRYHLVVSNPPFLPTPPGVSLFTSSDAGPLGVSVIERLLDDVREHLISGGRLLLLALSFGGTRGDVVTEMVRSAFSFSGDSVESTDVYGTALPVEVLLGLFAAWPSTREWRGKLASQGLTHVRFLLIEARRDGPLERRGSLPPIQETLFSGSWEARLHRYGLWLQAYQRMAVSTVAQAEGSCLPGPTPCR